MFYVHIETDSDVVRPYPEARQKLYSGVLMLAVMLWILIALFIADHLTSAAMRLVFLNYGGEGGILAYGHFRLTADCNRLPCFRKLKCLNDLVGSPLRPAFRADSCDPPYSA